MLVSVMIIHIGLFHGGLSLTTVHVINTELFDTYMYMQLIE